MYCKKCGKPVDDGVEVCAECLAQEQAVATETATPVQETPAQPVSSNKKLGLKKAIIGLVLSYLGLMILSYVSGELLMEMAYEEFDPRFIEWLDPDDIALWMAMSFIAIIPAIPGLILSIKALNLVRAEVRMGRPAPVATKIVSIIGLAMSIFTMASGVILAFCFLLIIALV
ncbi:MAG: zinc ribbon domain-containing protein [Clostridia bacterium]|nr:zinc ribbon domain-containing protein [Clostridia bacterium]